MQTFNTSLLQTTLKKFQKQIPEFSDYQIQLEKQFDDINALINLYDQIYPLLEKILWHSDNITTDFDSQLITYQSLFREQQALLNLSYNSSNKDRSYNFILSIPIADRPEHLKGCLESIFQLCKLYAYGGTIDNETEHKFYKKIIVVIVEDSKEQTYIDKDIELAEKYRKKGLQVHHYGLTEQYELMIKIPENLRQDVSSIIGDPATENFYHKGQAVTRNLSYLKAIELTEQTKNFTKDNVLYFFVDSDQLFQTNLPDTNGDRNVYGLNYFYYINRIFNSNDIAMLTGKLVGDPPVSPSVMSVNFLEDMIAFFKQLATQSPHKACQFHPQSKIKPADAAYHDMAQLFGLEDQQSTYDYCCSIQGEHDHISCVKKLAQRINYFFFGEHLTRKTYFTYKNPLTEITPARTIYPGNYICTFAGLKYIIPFGKLRLRMSGPTAGRLIQSEIKDRFMSSSLPMLHNRTLQTNFKDEYRPGVEDQSEAIDLSNEFERQFFGDLMLFSVARLTKSEIPIEQFSQTLLAETFSIVEDELLELYKNKHNNVNARCKELSILVNNKNYWWNQQVELSESISLLQQFVHNMQHNFSKQTTAYQQIQSKYNRQKKITIMINALLSYRHDRKSWDQILFNIL